MPHRLPRVSGRETELPLVTCCAAETREGQALSFASARVCKRIGSPLVNLKCSESRGWTACPLNVPLTLTRIAAHGCARAQFYVFHVRPARSIFSNALRPRCAVHARLRAKPYTRMEFTSFEANAAQSPEKRRMVILRCEDAPLLGLFAPHVDQDLVGIGEPEERRSRILAAAEGRSQALQPPPRPFIGVPPRIASFTGRADELDRLDAILMRDKPAAVAQQAHRSRPAERNDCELSSARTNTRRHPVRFDHQGSDEGRCCRSTPACSNAEGVGTKVDWGTPEFCSRTTQPNTRQMRTRDPRCPFSI